MINKQIPLLIVFYWDIILPLFISNMLKGITDGIFVIILRLDIFDHSFQNKLVLLLFFLL